MSYTPRNLLQIGQSFDTNTWGKITIIEYKSAKDIIVQFENTGNLSSVHASSIRKGYVSDRQEWLRQIDERKSAEAKSKKEEKERKDREAARIREDKAAKRRSMLKQKAIKKAMTPSFYGIGYMDIGPHKAYLGDDNYHPAYKTWKAMLNRCYGKNIHKCYDDCTVHPIWHSYQNFAEWYDNNYPKCARHGTYHLDKDIRIKGNRQYGPDACKFVTRSENLRAVWKHRLK